MSYHLALRSLRLSRRTPKVGTFVDCLIHGLAGDHPAAQLRQQMRATAAHQLAVDSLSDRLGELLAVDLNPVGQIMRFARSDETYRRAWDCYNQNGNVIARVGYGGAGTSGGTALASASMPHISRLERIQEQAAHERMMESYQQALSVHLRGNRNELVLARKVEDSRVSAVARVYGMGALIVELSECFEAHPDLNVARVCARMNLHPRLLERRMRSLGMTPVLLKQACMLANATRQILMGRRSLTEIATSSGYSNGAHLTRAVVRATGGLSPTLLRGFMHPA